MASRPYRDVMFGPYAPDYGGLPIEESPGPGYLTDCINLRSTPNGYRGTATFANVASATAIGGAGMNYALGHCEYNLSNICFHVVTDSGTIYESRAEGTDTWLNVSPAVGTLSPFGDFVRFGDDVAFAGSTHVPIRKSLSATQATLFTNVGGSPPTGATAARVRQHMVLGALQGDDLYAVQWSAIGNYQDWPVPGTADALAKEAGRESLNPEYGQVIRVLGGEKSGIVMQQHALTRMTYVGGSTVYEFDPYERIDGGGLAMFSRPVTDGVLWYFYSETGLYATDGYSVKSVSDGKIDEALFLNTISHPNGSSIFTAFTSVYDSRRGEVLFGASANTGGGSRYLLTYNVKSGSCSLLSDTNQMSYFSGFNTNAAPASGGRQLYNIGAADRKLQRRSGSTPTVALQTGYIEIDPGYTVQFQGAHLLGTGTSGLTIAYKTAISSSACDVSQSGFTSLTSAGRGQKSIGRPGNVQYIAFRVTGTGAESQLIRGVRIYFERAEPAS